MLKLINEEEFKGGILKSSKLTLVDFFASWCEPCRMLTPILEEVAKESDKFDILKIDIDDNRDVALEYEIEFVPTIVIFKDGKELDRIQGVADKESILEKIREFI